MKHYSLLDLTKSRIVLYFFFIIAFLQFFYLAMHRDIFFMAVFCLTGIVFSQFTKNMIVILVLCIVFTNVVRYGTNAVEGFEQTVGKNGDELELSEEGNQKVVELKKEADKISQSYAELLEKIKPYIDHAETISLEKTQNKIE